MKNTRGILLICLAILFLIPAALAVDPTAAFSINRTGDLGIFPQSVYFNDTSTGTLIAYWNLSLQGVGNDTVWYNTTSFPAENYTHTYAFVGNFSPYMIVTDTLGTNQTVPILVNTVWGAPTSTFTADKSGSIGSRPQTVVFADTTGRNVSVWLWNFGDGNTSASQNPTFVFDIPGNWSVTLTATSIEGSSVSAATYENVTWGLPAGSFSANRSIGYLGDKPQAVQFTDTSSPNVSGWQWNLTNTTGTGIPFTFSTSQHPSYTFTVAGNYTVGLVATSIEGSGTSPTAGYNVTWGLPVVSFTTNRSGNLGIYPQTVLFTDTSTNNASTRLWQFGDGNTSTSSPVSFTYNVPGNWSANLTAYSIEGSALSSNVKMNVSHKLPIASFVCTRPGGDLNTTYNLNGTRPFTLVCNATTVNPITAWDSWSWYGTGWTSNQTTRNVSVTFTYGGYKTVNLIAGNEAGFNTSSSPAHYIWVMKPSPSMQGFDPSPQGVFGGFWEWLMDFLHEIFGGTG